MDQMTEKPQYLGCLEGHSDWVTCIRTPSINDSEEAANTVVSCSRDKKVFVWRLNYSEERSEVDGQAGYALTSLSGHSQPISDLALSSNGKFAITSSWDKTLRLWDIEHSKSLRTFIGHESDVNSVALSPDNRQIVSGSRDKNIFIWNTKAECKYVFDKSPHSDWVSSVRFSPSSSKTLIVSCGWDKLVKVWKLDGYPSLTHNLAEHTGPLYTVSIAPDGSLCASGGKDGTAVLWDINEGKKLFSLSCNSAIHSLVFSPSHYWLCMATDNGVKIWNLEDEKNIICTLNPGKQSDVYGEENDIIDIKRPTRATGIPSINSLAWSANGRYLFCGSTRGKIHVYDFKRE